MVALLNADGEVAVRYEYDAWGNHVVTDKNGNPVTSGIGVLNPFRYRGYYYDTETELYYLQTRYYDPELGRFISQDSIEYAAPETINGLNLYAYCANNPVMNIDPTGKFFISLLVAIAAGAIIGGTLGVVKATIKGENLLAGFLSGALVGGVLGGAMMLGGAAMLAVAGKAVVGIGVLTTIAAKTSFLVGTAVVSYVASVGAGMGAYAIQESMNGRPIYQREMWRQGLNTGIKGIFSFATGMVLAAAGAYPNLLNAGSLTALQKLQRSLYLFWNYGIPRSIASFIIQTPWRLLIE